MIIPRLTAYLCSPNLSKKHSTGYLFVVIYEILRRSIILNLIKTFHTFTEIFAVSPPLPNPPARDRDPATPKQDGARNNREKGLFMCMCFTSLSLSKTGSKYDLCMQAQGVKENQDGNVNGNVAKQKV